MTTATEVLDRKIQSKHLLHHPFYQAWSKGELTREDLAFYAQQYFAHVRAFPVYLSEMHSRCENLQHRRLIAANLADEEASVPTHLDLWLDFAEGMGADLHSVLNAEAKPRVRYLVETFRSLAKRETVEAASALYCYEKQIPDVAEAKIRGLKDCYGVGDSKTLRYFDVHQSADIEHAAQWAEMLNGRALDSGAVSSAADLALGALWGALDEIYEHRSSRAA